MKPTHRFSAVAGLAPLIGLLLTLTAQSHDHDEAAPPPPSERRTVVNDAELAKEVKETASHQKKVIPETVQLPPLPAGVEELSFKDFYKMPVGPLGLEPTDKLRSLNGKRVRILGYMAQIHQESKRQMLFAPMPLSPQPEEYGPADEIPAAHILVTVPGNPDEELRYTPGPMLLTGVISVGSQEGSTSFVRMQLDAPAAPAAASPAVAMPAPAPAAK